MHFRLNKWNACALCNFGFKCFKLKMHMAKLGRNAYAFYNNSRAFFVSFGNAYAFANQRWNNLKCMCILSWLYVMHLSFHMSMCILLQRFKMHVHYFRMYVMHLSFYVTMCIFVETIKKCMCIFQSSCVVSENPQGHSSSY